MTDDASLPGRLAKAVAEGSPGLARARRICEALCEMLGADGASITLHNPTMYRVTWCATDERAGELENLQDVLSEGPCMDAYASRLPVSTQMGRWAASRWPQFIPAAERVLGPHGALWSLPMRASGEVIGTVSVYRLDGGTLAEPIDAAQQLADAAASMLLKDPATGAEMPGPDPWSTRSVVHQAVGILMGQLGVDADDALAMLRSQAFSIGTQLADVARAIIDGRLDLSDR